MSRLYGAHAISDLLNAAPEVITALWMTKGESSTAAAELAAKAKAHGIPIHATDRADLRKRAGSRGGVAIAADLRTASVPDLHDLAETAQDSPVLIALDSVTDPHNLGAILRSAAAFGATAVIAPKDRSAPMNDAAIRAAAGATALVPYLRVTNLARSLTTLAEAHFWITGAKADAEKTCWESDLTGATVLVMGAEGSGIRPNVARRCDLFVRLPMVSPLGSLNVSVSTGILMAECARQRVAKPAQKTD